MASDVDGIYNKDPKINPDAELLEVVTSSEQIELIKNTQTIDVTGEMRGKLTELLELANIGVESEIINANKFNIIKNALNGEKVIGTLIKKNNF
jgi:isopentenyl phosphate kinase